MVSLYSKVAHTLPLRVLLLFFAFTLAACGGGGGGGGNNPPPPPPPSIDASLSALSISSGSLSPSFLGSQITYTTTVAYPIDTITLNATPNDSKATQTIGGVTTAAGVNSSPIALTVGNNVIDVEVTAEDGVTTRTYSITVTREAPSTDASLSALSISNGSLNPVFDSNTTSYTATVINTVNAITINANPTDSNASFTVDGVAGTGGVESAPIALAVGPNSIDVAVTAEDGSTVLTYNLAITRLPSAALSALSLTDANLDQSFQSSQTSYTSGVNFFINAVRVNATLDDTNATMTVNGVATDSGVDSELIYLTEGSNTIDIIVTAVDSTTTETYSIDLTRQSTSSLAELAYNGSGAGTNDYFGFSIAIDGDTMVVGADWKDVTDADSNLQIDAGAVYVFTRNGGSWTEQAMLTAATPVAYDYFGHSVAIDGDTVVVGAYWDKDKGFNSGAAYIFTRSGTAWSQQAKLTASNAVGSDQFGVSVDISADTAVIGTEKPYGSSEEAYVFIRSGSNWSEQDVLTASNADLNDKFGKSVAIEGDAVVVGAPLEDGASLSNDGAAYVFTRSVSTWTEQKILKADNAANQDLFGSTVAISGNRIAVGAIGKDSSAGAAYVFTGSGSSWSQQAFLQASNAGANDNFGVSLSISGERLVVGADAEDGDVNSTSASPNDSGDAVGAAYVFMFDGSVWSQTAYIKASDAANGDSFGASVGIDGDTVAVGAIGKSASGTAIVYQ